MTRPRILDTYCCAGGAGMGYHLAGFDVVGVDIEARPRYPFEFHQADALEVLADAEFMAGFDAVHASPPCQFATKAQRIRGNTHPNLIAPTRDLVAATGLPYVIENVPDARAYLINPVELCGCMFPELGVYRERLFEAPWVGLVPPHNPHREPLTKMGRPPKPGERMHVVGNFSGVQRAREAMGIDWMARDELREAIPPAYTRFLGAALLEHLAEQEAAA